MHVQHMRDFHLSKFSKKGDASSSHDQSVPLIVLILFLLYIILFTAGYIYLIHPLIRRLPPYLGIVLDFVVKSVCVIVPAVLLMRKYSDRLDIPFKQTFLYHWKGYLFIAAVLTFLFFYSVVESVGARGGSLYFSFQKISELEQCLIAGISEEIAFRGWLLNAFMRKFGIIIGTMLDTIIFVLGHIQIWLYNGATLWMIKRALFSEEIIPSVIVTVIFCVLFKASKNLIFPAFFHICYDCMSLFI